jgi:hypothetical protein
VTRGACLAIAALLLTPLLAVRSTRLARGVVDAVRQLSTDDFEQRRLESYGYCEPRGYGYAQRVLARFPDPDVMPAVRYRPGYDGYVASILLRPRPRLEPRVLIGVGIAEPPAAGEGRPFIVVGRHDTCFTAVRDDLLDDIARGHGRWTQWLADVRSIR